MVLRSEASPEVRLQRAAAAQASALAGILGTGAVLAVTSLQLPLACPLRMLTGIPCPLCGMTTGTVAFLKGDLSSALAANPLSVAFVPLAAAALADRVARLVTRRPARPWPAAARRSAVAALGAALTGAWVFEAFRFGVL